MTVEEKGMPFHKSSFKFGNLFIMFKVVFPDQVSASESEEVKQVISKLQKMEVKAPSEELSETKYLRPYDKAQRNTHH